MKTQMTAIVVLTAVLLAAKSQVTAGETAPQNMALIPAGTFQMGDAFNEGTSAELPVHSVYVSAFYMDKTEVSKASWEVSWGEVYQWATNHSYSFDNIGFSKYDFHPVVGINWYDAVKWCNARSEKEERVPAYYTDATQTTVYRRGQVDIQNDWVKWNAGYRLPTEAEWEKAARGGLNEKRFPWGNTINDSQANYNSNRAFDYDLSKWFGYNQTYCGFPDNGFPCTSPPVSFVSNGYELYNMVGNVWEWCWDWYDSSYYSFSPETNPKGDSSGLYRVIRGGSWRNYAQFCRSANRGNSAPGKRGDNAGFRTVLPSTIPDLIQVIETRPPQPTYGVCPNKENGKDSLVVVTHGRVPRGLFETSPPANVLWVDEMLDVISKNLISQGHNNWQVSSYNWIKKAWTTKVELLLGITLDRAKDEGENLGKCIVGQGFAHIHLIAHSAGAALIQVASETIKSLRPDITVHLTFLDAYIGLTYGGRQKYGEGANWADSYYSRDPDTGDILTGLTGGSLKHAYNIDVTWLDPNKHSLGTYRSSWNGEVEECYETVTHHEWSHEFYLKTITQSWGDAKGFGFPLSKEGGNWDFALNQYKVGNNPSLVLGNPDPSCIPDMTLPPPDWNPILDFARPLLIRSSTGTSQVSDRGVTLTTGSPVWLAVPVQVTNALNLLSFETKFLSGSGAEGLLSVYWNTNTVGSVDERVVLPDLRQYTFTLPNTTINGSHLLGFRLDSFSGVTSSVLVTNVSLGFVGIKQPFSLEVINARTNRLQILRLNGPSGFNYRVEASTNLVDWKTIAILVNTNGVVRFVDPTSTNTPSRFYRAVVP